MCTDSVVRVVFLLTTRHGFPLRTTAGGLKKASALVHSALQLSIPPRCSKNCTDIAYTRAKKGDLMRPTGTANLRQFRHCNPALCEQGNVRRDETDISEYVW